jgi:hypothetical protein
MMFMPPTVAARRRYGNDGAATVGARKPHRFLTARKSLSHERLR